MKKGIWPITFGVLLMLYQIFGVQSAYVEFINAHSVCYPIFGFTVELLIGNTVLYHLALYIVGVLSILLIIWGFQSFIKDSPESVETNRFVTSYRALKDTRTLAQCAILVALYIILDMLPKFPYFEITFGFVALAGIAYISGPVTGFFSGGICEILGYLIAPKTGPLHLGFTFTAMLTGFVMGCFLYDRNLSIWRVIISRSIVAVFLNLGLNTYWLSNLYGQAYLALIPSRALKLLQLPFDVFLIFLAIQLIAKINKNLQPVKSKQVKKKQK